MFRYNLDAGTIKDPDEFTASLLSVFQNAADFNEPNKVYAVCLVKHMANAVQQQSRSRK
jgi:hypothetical protein